MRMKKMDISRSLRDELGCVEANEGAVTVRRRLPDFGEVDALEVALTTGCRSVNAKWVC